MIHCKRELLASLHCLTHLCVTSLSSNYSSHYLLSTALLFCVFFASLLFLLASHLIVFYYVCHLTVLCYSCFHSFLLHISSDCSHFSLLILFSLFASHRLASDLHQTCIALASDLHRTCIGLHQTCIRLASDLHDTCIG